MNLFRKPGCIHLFPKDGVFHDKTANYGTPPRKAILSGCYSDGKRTGEWILKDDTNGNLVARVPFEGGEEHGTYLEYHEDGKTPRLRSFYSGGKLEGVYNEFYENGSIKVTYLFAGAKRTSAQTEFYRTGVPKPAVHFEDAVRHGSPRGAHPTADPGLLGRHD